MKRQHRILIIDDDVDYADVVRCVFEDGFDYEVCTLHQGFGVLEKVRQFAPDLILLDVCLPDMDGGIIAEKLQAHPALNHIPILFVTSLVEAEDVSGDYLRSGGLHFLPKLMPMNQFTSIVQSMVEGQACQEAVCCPAA